MSRLLAFIASLESRGNAAFLGAFVAFGLILAIGLPVPVAGLIVIAAAAFSAVSPSAALGACLAATPLIFRPISIGDGSWMLLELALVAAMIGLAGRVTLECAATRSIGPVRELVPDIAVLIGGAVLIALSALALTNLADPGHRDASLRAVRTIILEPLVVVPLTLRVLRRGRIEVALGALAAMLVVVVGWGIIGLLRGSGVAADGVRRAVGPYDHPNNLAFFIERATLLTAIPAFFHPRYRRIGIALLVVGGVAALATFSRGALIGLSAGAVVALWLIGRLRAIAGVAAALVAASGVLAVLAGERLFDSGGEGSEPSRFVIWDGAGRILRDFPLTGIGPDQFYVMYGLRYIEPVGWPERYTAHAHNLLLDFWLWFGIGGLLLAVVAFGWVAWRTIRLRRNVGSQGQINALPIAGAAALAAGLTHGLVDHGFLLPDLAVLTWFAVTLLIAPAAETEP